MKYLKVKDLNIPDDSLIITMGEIIRDKAIDLLSQNDDQLQIDFTDSHTGATHVPNIILCGVYDKFGWDGINRLEWHRDGSSRAFKQSIRMSMKGMHARFGKNEVPK